MDFAEVPSDQVLGFPGFRAFLESLYYSPDSAIRSQPKEGRFAFLSDRLPPRTRFLSA